MNHAQIRLCSRLATLWLVALLALPASSKRASSGPCSTSFGNTDVEGCQFKAKGLTLVCIGGLHENVGGNSRVRSLTLCQWPQETFDPEAILTLFPSLQKLTLTEGNVTRLLSDFPDSPLELVNMSRLQLEKISDSTFSRLQSLNVLDLRSNRLNNLDLSAIASPPLLEKVYLSGNEWNCSTDLTWMVDKQRNNSMARRVVDRDKLSCFGAPYPGKPLVPVMTYIKTLRSECPSEPPNNCSCWLSNIVWDTAGFLVPVIVVDCSFRGLTYLPDTLPANTTTLMAKGNQITSLKPLVSNPHYSRVSDIYLDDNDIRSVSELEGADWLLSFRVLSLRANRIAELPTYALDNALKYNSHAVNIFLGGNPWRCDCLFTPNFQDLLVKYLILVKDIYDIKCSYVAGDDNSLLEIRDLSRSAICREPSEYLIKPLDLLNGILALLIVLVVGKLCYDYWAFKKTGKLPWIVAKMP